MTPLIISKSIIFILMMLNITSIDKFDSIQKVHGCTSFTIATKEELLFARNLDVDSDFGYIFLNPRGIKKTAYLPSNSNEKAVQWVSKYGSISFNQISRDIPHGGYNESGLVVEHLYLESTIYPKTDSRPVIISHQFIQYLLDQCGSVDEVELVLNDLRISNIHYKIPIHFHLMDEQANRAILEFIDGELKIYKDATYEAFALANSTYHESIKHTKQYKTWGGNHETPLQATESLDRFLVAASRASHYDKTINGDAITYCYESLDAVRNSTQWQIVYDLKKKRINYRTESNKTIQTLELTSFDFDESNKVKAIPIQADLQTSNWTTYSTSLNRMIIQTICEQSEFLKSTFGEEIEQIAIQPELY